MAPSVPVVVIYIWRWTDYRPRTLLFLPRPPPAIAAETWLRVCLRSAVDGPFGCWPQVVKNLSGSSVIELGEKERTWGMNATVYAEHMIRSR